MSQQPLGVAKNAREGLLEFSALRQQVERMTWEEQIRDQLSRSLSRSGLSDSLQKILRDGQSMVVDWKELGRLPPTSSFVAAVQSSEGVTIVGLDGNSGNLFFTLGNKLQSRPQYIKTAPSLADLIRYSPPERTGCRFDGSDTVFLVQLRFIENSLQQLSLPPVTGPLGTQTRDDLLSQFDKAKKSFDHLVEDYWVNPILAELRCLTHSKEAWFDSLTSDCVGDWRGLVCAYTTFKSILHYGEKRVVEPRVLKSSPVNKSFVAAVKHGEQSSETAIIFFSHDNKTVWCPVISGASIRYRSYRPQRDNYSLSELLNQCTPPFTAALFKDAQDVFLAQGR